MRIVLLNILIVLLSFLPMCKKDKVKHGIKTPVAEYRGRYFYLEDMGNEALQRAQSAPDSVNLINSAVSEWVSNVQIEELAERNINNMMEVERKVNEYRQQLLTYEYEKQLLERRVISEANDEEIEKFYQDHKDLYVAKTPLIKGIILQLQKNSSVAAKTRGWMKEAFPSDMENIEKISAVEAISYEYFRGDWKPLGDVFPSYKKFGNDILRSLSSKTFYEISDSDTYSFFKIDGFCLEGDLLPMEYARTQISEVLHNLKEMEYMNQIRKELIEKARKKGDIHYQGRFTEVMKEVDVNKEQDNKK